MANRNIKWFYSLRGLPEMETHSSTLAWKIPWMDEPGRLQSMGSQRIGHNWATSPSPDGSAVKNLPANTEGTIRCWFYSWVEKIPWRRKWQLTPNIFAWEIPWTEEPGRLQSMRSQHWLAILTRNIRVKHDLVTKSQQSSLIIREMQIKTTASSKLKKYHLILVRMLMRV